VGVNGSVACSWVGVNGCVLPTGLERSWVGVNGCVLSAGLERSWVGVNGCVLPAGLEQDSEPVLFQGRTEGKIVSARGPLDFGWDPVFEPVINPKPSTLDPRP